MAPTLLFCEDQKDPWQNFATDLDVLRAVYNEFMRLRVAGEEHMRPYESKEQQAKAPMEIIDFDAFQFIHLMSTAEDEASNHRLCLEIALSLTDRTWEFPSWVLRAEIRISVYDDWTVSSGISCYSVYDGRPVVNPARLKWQKIVKWMNAVRPYAWHWFEQYQKSSCSESGINKKRDLEAFKLDFIE